MDPSTLERLRAKAAHLRTCLNRMREAENPNTHSTNEYIGRLNRLALSVASDLSSLLDALPALLDAAEAAPVRQTCATCQHYTQDPHRMSGLCEMSVKFDRHNTVPHNFGCILHTPAPPSGGTAGQETT